MGKRQRCAGWIQDGVIFLLMRNPLCAASQWLVRYLARIVIYLLSETDADLHRL